MDQGRLAGREDDAAQLPSVPIERGVALADCDRLQSGKPVATASVAEEDWELVADELAAAAGKDGRSAGETCVLLLAFAGRRTSESEAVRQHAENDRGVAAAGQLANQDKKANERSEAIQRDRKSTRLNSSHGYISYAVFCLKKKTTYVNGGTSTGTSIT